ncbi:MAG: O-antigen ligase family protein [Candidatus Moraniibacteriota bacterium]
MKKLFNLENLIYLTILALPTYLLRFNIGGFPTNMLDWLIFACVVIWLFSSSKKNELQGDILKFKPIIIALGVIFIGLIASMLMAKSSATGLGIIKSWFVLPVLFSIVTHSVIREDKLKNVFFTYYLSAFIVALISLGFFMLGLKTYDMRLEGFFNSPNYLAMYLAPAFFIGFGFFIEASFKRKIFIGLSSLAIFWVLYLTCSYSSWIAIVGVCMLMLVVSSRKNLKRWLVIWFLLAILFFSQVEKNKFADLVSGNSRSSLSSRVMIWRSAEKMLESNWLFGIGAGNFQEEYLAYQKYFPPYLEWAVPHPHNVYLAFWLYGGALGLLGFLSLVCFWFYYLFKSQKKPNLKLIGLGIMGYILLHGLVDTTYFKNDLAVIFWLLFTLL